MNTETEISIRKELGVVGDADISLDSHQSIILSSGEWHTFWSRPGRSYRVFVINLDSKNKADKVQVFHNDFNNLVKTLRIEPLSAEVAFAEMSSNGIRVYNRSKRGAEGSPKVYVLLYPA